MKMWIVSIFLALFSLQAFAATEWRVKSYQGSTTRSTVSEKVDVGTRCADVVMWRSPTGKG